MSKKNNENMNWGVNLAAITEAEAREYVEQMREDLRPETDIMHFLEDVKKAKESMKELSEKSEEDDNPLEPNPLTMDRRTIPDGIYEVRNCAFQVITNIDELKIKHTVIKAKLFIYDYDTDRKIEINRTYTEAFFEKLYESLSIYFNEFKPKSLMDCLKLCKEHTWYVEKITKGIFTNYYPCKYSPTIADDKFTQVISIMEI